jgi:hypothetical protein
MKLIEQIVTGHSLQKSKAERRTANAAAGNA